MIIQNIKKNNPWANSNQHFFIHKNIASAFKFAQKIIESS